MSDAKIAEVAVNLPLKDAYHYSIPEKLQGQVVPGVRVWVNFGHRQIIGYVTELVSHSDVPNLKPLLSVIDEKPIIPQDLLKLSRWMSEYYFSSLGEALGSCIPAPLKKGKTKIAPRGQWEIKEGVLIKDPRFNLTVEQEDALTPIKTAIKDNKTEVFLLHGITSSGKTEVYIQAIAETLSRGRDAIVLVPEIALTPQTVERFQQRFGGLVAVLHSRMAGSEKFHFWQKIREGACRIVVGPRSAIFSPMRNLGLVVIDEEHEHTYKQEDVPRYWAVDTAIERARINQAVVILGSATPSLESFYQAEKGGYKLLPLNNRIDKRPLPEVQVVRMMEEMPRGGTRPVFSRILEHRIRETISKGKQAILFLNRRGFSTYIYCQKCGFVLRCRRCAVAMVYHFDKQQAICHYCNDRQDLQEICPKCQSAYFRYFGTGTQKVESELHRLFPDARICRMDSDSTVKRGAHSRILDDFKHKKINILIGTQMLAKGLDFPEVTLVGVIFADVTINLPDFRAAEKTFSLLTQVAGRCGRGEDKGRVIVQTYLPEHYAIVASARHDYAGFYQQEMAFRQELDLPPFSHIIEIILRGRPEDKVESAIKRLHGLLRDELPRKKIKMIGPSPSPVYVVRRRFHWQILLKVKEPREVNKYLKTIFAKFRKPQGMHLAIDVDPR